MKIVTIFSTLVLMSFPLCALASSPSGAQRAALRILNQKENTVRIAILKERAEQCITNSSDCNPLIEGYEKNTYEFTASDVLSVTALGHSEFDDPCFAVKCEGENSSVEGYVILVKSDLRGRWRSEKSVVALQLEFARKTSQANGHESKAVDLWALTK